MNVWQDRNWFAVQSRPHAEALAAAHLRRLDLEVFLPHHRVQMPVAGIRRWVTRPLFPGYFFSRFVPLVSLHAIRSSTGVLRVVGNIQFPTPLPDEVITGLQGQVDADDCVHPEPRTHRRGERVRIEEGPFAGWIGRVEREADDQRRVLILLEALQQARVWLDESVVETASDAGWDS